MTPTTYSPSTPSRTSTSRQLPRPRSPRPRSNPLPPPLPISPRPQQQRNFRVEQSPPETPTRKQHRRQPSPRPRSYPLPPPLPLSPPSPRSPQRPSRLLAGSGGTNGVKNRADNVIRTPPRSVPPSYAQGYPSPSSSPSPPLTSTPSPRPSLDTPTRQDIRRKHVSFPCPPSPPPLYTTDTPSRLIPDMSLSPTAIASAFSASAFLVAWTVLVLDESPSMSVFRGLDEVENGFGAMAVMGLSEALGAIGKVVEGGWLASLWWSTGKKRQESGKRRRTPGRGKRRTIEERPQVDGAGKGKGKMVCDGDGDGAMEDVLRAPTKDKMPQGGQQQTLKLSGKGERRARSSRTTVAAEVSNGIEGKN